MRRQKNAARGYCLPFFSSIGEKEGRIIKALLEPMGNMNFGVGVDLQGKIITSDNPVYIELSQWPCDEYDYNYLSDFRLSYVCFYLEMKIRKILEKIFCLRIK